MYVTVWTCCHLEATFRMPKNNVLIHPMNNNNKKKKPCKYLAWICTTIFRICSISIYELVFWVQREITLWEIFLKMLCTTKYDDNIIHMHLHDFHWCRRHIIIFWIKRVFPFHPLPDTALHNMEELKFIHNNYCFDKNLICACGDIVF